MEIKTAFDIGEFVYLQTDPEQIKRVVTGIKVRRNSVAYIICYGDREESEHYDFELSHEKNLMMELGIDKQATE